MARRRKIPTKTELLQLQKLYKTDEKIGERLGGVPAYLVAYWRRKKNVPKYSLPKFSEQEIRNLWERFGDDEKAGLELGISKAAFYNWRRRYGLREKPAFLKLEQLELNFPGSKLGPHASQLYGNRSVAQKIIARAGGIEKVAVGETIEVEPNIVSLHGSIADVVRKFREHNVEYIANPNRTVITLGGTTESQAGPDDIGMKAIWEFVRRQGVKTVYDLREGTCQQVILEKGHIVPGQFAATYGSGAHAYGSLGALSFSFDAQATANLWATGRLSVEVPATVRITVSGRRYRGIYAKDIVLAILEKLGQNGARNRVIEFAGSVVSQMSISDRFTLTDIASEMGARAALCPYDATTRRYLTGRAQTRSTPLLPDKDAEYHEQYQVNIDQLVPMLYRPGENSEVRPVTELEGSAVHQCILGCCASGRFDELRVAADILKGKQVHPDCRMFVVPGSRTTYLEALKKGLIRVFVEAGAIVLSPGSCACESIPQMRLDEGERCLASTNSHIKNHLGTGDPDLYLCSPATVAAAALNGEITEATRFLK